jgi:hypothetical protein
VIKKLLTVVGLALLLTLGAAAPTVVNAGAEPNCQALSCW